jgi:hypothetical protein
MRIGPSRRICHQSIGASKQTTVLVTVKFTFARARRSGIDRHASLDHLVGGARTNVAANAIVRNNFRHINISLPIRYFHET